MCAACTQEFLAALHSRAAVVLNRALREAQLLCHFLLGKTFYFPKHDNFPTTGRQGEKRVGQQIM